MDFQVNNNKSKTKHGYSATTIDIAYKFAKEIHDELKDMLKAVVLFGSAARKKDDVNDIDILLILDDVSIKITPELTQAYRIIVENTVAKVDTKIHVTSMKFTSFWEYIRVGDPIAMNILRDGYALLDTGFFDPIQMLLHQGRIRPSTEALWAYFNRAPRSLRNARGRLSQACIDLYWCVIDASHAMLMSINEVPPSPEHVAELIDAKIVKKNLLDKEMSTIVRKFFNLSKEISSGKKQEVSGKEFEEYYKLADKFLKAAEKFIKE